MEHISRYHIGIDLDDESTSHALVIRSVGVGKKVLELGSAVGDTTRVLKERGCTVVAVELDPVGAAATARWADRVIATNLESCDLRDEVEGGCFDVVVAADVLEHLRNPGDVLRQVRGLLAPGGYVVASIPNVAHGAVRLALLGGTFDYAEVGLLDRTHVHFFTLSSLTALFEESGYRITRIERVSRAFDDASVPYNPHNLTPEVERIIADDPECYTFQFVVTADPAPGTPGAIDDAHDRACESPEAVIERLRTVNAAMADQIRATNERNELVALRLERERLFRSRTWKVAVFLQRVSRGARDPRGLARRLRADRHHKTLTRTVHARSEPTAVKTTAAADAHSLRVLAFYLPQFHPIDENDAWWGQGFTEWTNVVKARPKFRGHYQPHVPSELGFYDLRVAEVREAQAALARRYGVDGFVYYHYWFNGHRLLHRPFDEVLASGRPDFPFCLCWANENWTRVWDGGQDQVLAAQHYSEADDLAHIRALLPALVDSRYITVESKPLLLIYRASHLPDPRRTLERWRSEAERAGLPGLYMCCVQSHTIYDRQDPRMMGFDAAVEFQPDGEGLGAPMHGPVRRLLGHLPGRATGHTVFSYDRLVEAALSRPDTPYRRYRCVTPSWDNTARRSKGATILTGSTPELYEQWLRSVVQSFVPYSSEENFVFINGWNEWAEANHLEPDQRWGRAYLEATQRALSP